MHIGNGAYISKQNWEDCYKVTSRIFLMAREMLSEVYGAEELGKRSLYGMQNPFAKNKKQATPAKIEAILGETMSSFTNLVSDDNVS